MKGESRTTNRGALLIIIVLALVWLIPSTADVLGWGVPSQFRVMLRLGAGLSLILFLIVGALFARRGGPRE